MRAVDNLTNETSQDLALELRKRLGQVDWMRSFFQQYCSSASQSASDIVKDLHNTVYALKKPIPGFDESAKYFFLLVTRDSQPRTEYDSVERLYLEASGTFKLVDATYYSPMLSPGHLWMTISFKTVSPAELVSHQDAVIRKLSSQANLKPLPPRTSPSIIDRIKQILNGVFN